MNGVTDSQRAAAIDLLVSWLQKRLTADEFQWLTAQIQESLRSNSDRSLFITLGKIPRKISRDDLQLDPAELTAGQATRPGWDPSNWSLSGAARILVLSQMAQTRGESFMATYRDICRTADVTELIELYSALPLLRPHTLLDQQIGDGLRSNMRSVFEAIAHRNPYPSENFDQHRWNHMILKLLFIDSTLAPVQQLDQRANPELATILCDYAHERWAAGRPVSCELWRCVGPFATDSQIDDLARALSDADVHQQQAAAIALAQSEDPAAMTVLQTNAPLHDAVIQGQLRWDGENPLPLLTGNNT